MTIHDPDRQWARPVEGIAKAMREYPTGRYDHANFPLLPSELGNATAALDWLNSHGFLNENALNAMKAEKAEQESK